MTRFVALTVVLLLAMTSSPATAADGGTGFWITLWPSATSGAVVVLYGAFCALWAQNSGRNAWLWFVLGAVFSIVIKIENVAALKLVAAALHQRTEAKIDVHEFSIAVHHRCTTIERIEKRRDSRQHVFAIPVHVDCL